MSGNLEKVKRGFNFFINNRGQEIRLRDLAEYTGWKLSTIQTYYSKKWKGQILNKASHGHYQVIIPMNMTWEGFESLQTQIDSQVR